MTYVSLNDIGDDDTHHFVGHHEQVMLFCNGRYLFQLVSREDLSDWIVRRINDDHFCARSNGTTSEE